MIINIKLASREKFIRFPNSADEHSCIIPYDVDLNDIGILHFHVEQVELYGRQTDSKILSQVIDTLWNKELIEKPTVLLLDVEYVIKQHSKKKFGTRILERNPQKAVNRWRRPRNEFAIKYQMKGGEFDAWLMSKIIQSYNNRTF